jgi:hypothetical protein
VWVELGFGSSLATVDDLQAHLGRLTLSPPVVALDRDVSGIAEQETPSLRVRKSTFHLELDQTEHPRVIRAMNVLRGYSAADARSAQQLLGDQLPEGGILLEGSSSPDGGVLCCHVQKKEGAQLRRWGLLFYTDFSQGFAPDLFRDRLPRDLRGEAGREGLLLPMLATWRDAWSKRPPARWDPRSIFLSTSEALGKINEREWQTEFVADGVLVWTPEAGVPAPTI